jgi:hypothetical protein
MSNASVKGAGGRMDGAVVRFFMFGYSVVCFAMLSRNLLSGCQFTN